MLELQWFGLLAVLAVAEHGLAKPITGGLALGNFSSYPAQLLGRDTVDDDGFDPSDLSFITRMAAIGDSYSAGIGAGTRLQGDGDSACSRYDNAYPNLIHNDGRLGDPASRTFQFKSCSGALTADVINNQIPQISGNQQVILLSAGGNDAELTKILNQCVFQWAVLNANQVNTAKAASKLDPKFALVSSVDWDSLGVGCAGQLARTQSIIDGDAFSESIDAVISAAKSKLASDGMIYYTGYAKFFAEDMSSDCDNVSWSTWIYKLYNMFQPEAKLTTLNRRAMNALVDAVNSKISGAVERAGNQVQFVNYDSYVGRFNGRFCEAGVDESTKESNTRTGLMFYELNTMDPFGSNPWKRTQEDDLEGTFGGTVNQFALITQLVDPDAQLSDQSMVVQESSALTASKVMSIEAAVQARSIPNLLPDGYGRVFHPQPLLHRVIASLVIYHMSNHNEVSHGYEEIPEEMRFDSCPYLSSNGSDSSASGQQVAVASYINPLADPSAWNRLVGYSPKKMPILVANVMNGPDSAVDSDWTDVITRAAGSGKTVLGYVRTGYLGVSQQKFVTRLGSGDLADWTAQIEEDVDMWYSLYGDKIGGIFFDEGWPECGANNEYVNLYKYINAYTKRAHPGALTILNPAKDPRKLWHIVYNVPESAISEVIKLSQERGAGFIQLTDDTLPNPYDNLPSDSYVQSMLDAVDGGSLKNAEAAGWGSGPAGGPTGGLSVIKTDYSLAKLSWTAASNALGYHIYAGDNVVASIPGSMTSVTIGGLQPGTSTQFHVRAVGGNGDMGFSTQRVTASTSSLPNGKTVANYHSVPKMGSTKIQADILVPFAFIRLYIWDSVGCDFDVDPGWSVNFKVDEYVCTKYMVEGTTLYKYSGVLPKGSTAPPWSWSVVGDVPLTISGYTYTWDLPIGTQTIDTSKFVVQAQGYNPLIDAYEPSPEEYDCKGSSMCSTPDFLKWCDHAVNYLQRNDQKYYGTYDSQLTGNCWGDQTRGCGVFIQGNNCSISGNDLWNDYQNIRNVGGCKKCGSFHRPDGCLVTINYVYTCDNHEGA
ncbi:hypothetical protein N7539_007789 [Penicillium diatomitis]|uniref:Fibronectin type-III domain-containing protein n=1 Tax=Penicillium diatomitis TaxID=2819901 RepID=A0A9W9WTZ6_9EURO|nr:uncharacterized protein N7539_007789 [Penicillium diatomitis]KAJ5475502.1 hypothetical protein N7539_007789 [Penicillium diatomitis]